MFGPNISGGDACSPVQRRGILVRGVLGPLEQENGFSRDSWSSHGDVTMTLGFS